MAGDDETETPPKTGGTPLPAATDATSTAVGTNLPPGMESVLPEDAPRIRLPEFEGPLDLLLYLIRRDSIDIHDIPIAPITRQYMEYLELMQELQLDVAGEFMVMAATLIHIKSKLLVPRAPAEAAEDQEADPRDALVERLLEFQRYKEAAGLLHQKGELRAATWVRPEGAVPLVGSDGKEILEAGLFDLIGAFKALLERRKTLLAHEVEAATKSLEERMEEVLTLVGGEGQSLDFLDLFESLETKADMILTFLALLELVRLKRVRVYQRGLFGPIRVFRPVGPEGGLASAPDL